MGGGSYPNKGWEGFDKGGGLPKSKAPMLSLRKFSMIVSLFFSMMEFTNTAFRGWFMKASMSVGDVVVFSRLKDG